MPRSWLRSARWLRFLDGSNLSKLEASGNPSQRSRPVDLDVLNLQPQTQPHLISDICRLDVNVVGLRRHHSLFAMVEMAGGLPPDSDVQPIFTAIEPVAAYC